MTLVDVLYGLEPDTAVKVHTKSGRSVAGLISDDPPISDAIVIVLTDQPPPANPDASRAYVLLSEIEGFDW